MLTVSHVVQGTQNDRVCAERYKEFLPPVQSKGFAIVVAPRRLPLSVLLRAGVQVNDRALGYDSWIGSAVVCDPVSASDAGGNCQPLRQHAFSAALSHKWVGWAGFPKAKLAARLCRVMGALSQSFIPCISPLHIFLAFLC